MHDVIIVGAGPGGAAAAGELARRGLSALLLDKAGFPRDKTCGDALTPRAVRALHRLGRGPAARAGGGGRGGACGAGRRGWGGGGALFSGARGAGARTRSIFAWAGGPGGAMLGSPQRKRRPPISGWVCLPASAWRRGPP